MVTDTQWRNKLLRQINSLPNDKLIELEGYISKMVPKAESKNRTLAMAGAWLDIDDSVFEDLTKNLIENRQKNRSRIDE